MAATAPIGIVVDIPFEDLERDPYPHYARLRVEAPVAWIPALERVHVATWDLCNEAGRNSKVFGPTLAFNRIYGEPNVMGLDGPTHRDLRDSVRVPFLPPRVAEYAQTLLRPNAVRLIDAIRHRGGADINTELCEPVSLETVGALFGFHDVPNETLARWFHALGAYLVDVVGDPEVIEGSNRAKAEVRAYLEANHDRLRSSHDTAIGCLLSHGRTRSIDEIVATVGVIIVGGFQEPAHAIANALYGVLGRPEQARLVAAEPARWSEAVMEEGLRWLAPFGTTEKRTYDTVELGGVVIPAGTEIALGIGSANRDPARHDDPDTFDMTRASHRHFSFGFGSHFCIGNIFSVEFGRIVLEELFARLPNLRLDPDAEPLVHGCQVRAAKHLPVLWDA